MTRPPMIWARYWRLPAFLAALPARIDLSVEVPMTARMAAEGPASVLRRVHRATMGLLARP